MRNLQPASSLLLALPCLSRRDVAAGMSIKNAGRRGWTSPPAARSARPISWLGGGIWGVRAVPPAQSFTRRLTDVGQAPWPGHDGARGISPGTQVSVRTAPPRRSVQGGAGRVTSAAPSLAAEMAGAQNRAVLTSGIRYFQGAANSNRKSPATSMTELGST